MTVSGTNLNVGPVVVGKAMPTFFETNPRTVETYTATDPENDTITWSLSGPDASFFSIADGVLNFDSAGDYEDPRDAGRNNVYEVIIHASDGSNSAVFHVTVVIGDVDETPLVAGPTTINARGGTTAYVGRYGATDPEGFVTSWEPLSGVDAQHFEFSDAGDLSFTAVPDFDNPADTNGDNTYEVTVSASSDGDRGTRTGTLDVVVTVTDPNQVIRPPIIIGGGGGGGGPSGPTPSDEDFEWTVDHDIEALDGGNDEPTGIWSNGETLWLADNPNGAGDAVYAYDLESGERVPDREFELDQTNRAPRGLWSDRSTIWIADSGQNKLFAHDLESGERLPDSDLGLSLSNRDARGIWSDGLTLWVLDSHADALFAYELVSRDLIASYALHDANSDPQGLWSDGVTVWVSSDRGAKRVFAYRLPVLEPDGEEPDEDLVLERVRDEEFTKLSRASNNSPRGLWSDGDVMYVADASDGKIYSYNMPDAIDARLASLTLSGVDFGEFSPLRYDYASDTIPHGNIATLTATPAQPGASVQIEPGDHDGDPSNGHHLRLLPGLEIMITVTSEDASRRRVYRLLLGEEEAAGPSASCLRGAVNAGFSLVVYEGGSVEDLVACAESRHVTALYALDAGEYVPYIVGAPDFATARFRGLFPDGVPALLPLVVRSEGPGDAGPGRARGCGAVRGLPARRDRRGLQPRDLRRRQRRRPRGLREEPRRYGRLRAR